VRHVGTGDALIIGRQCDRYAVLDVHGQRVVGGNDGGRPNSADVCRILILMYCARYGYCQDTINWRV
jgi:hypothetical protein